MSAKNSQNLEVPSHPLALSWESGKISESLQKLFESVSQEAVKAAQWYTRAIIWKRRYAMVLRVFAIVSGAVAALIPVLAQMFVDDGRPRIQPAYASIAIGFAAALIVLDRFFGFSSAWMRYMDAQLKIRQLTQEFQLDWETVRAAWRGAEPTLDQVQDALSRLKIFATQVNAIVRQETDKWIQEFQSSLTQIDESARAKANVVELGAINLEITNGDQADSGWALSIDNGTATTFRGKTAGVRNLVPGTHSVKVEGAIAGNPKQAGSVVNISAGGTTPLQLTLS